MASVRQRGRRVVGYYDLLVLTAALWFFGKFIRYAFPPLFESLQAAYGVSNAAVGAAFSGFMLLYAAIQFPAGALADRLGAVAVIVTGGAVAVFGAVLMTVEAGFGLIVAAMVIIGAGTGVHKTVSMRLLAQRYGGETGRVFGAFDTAGTYGGVVAPLVVAALLTTPVLSVLVPGAPWRALFVYTAIVGAALLVVFFFRVTDTTSTTTTQDASLLEYVRILLRPRLGVFVVVTVCFGFTYNGVIAFLPLYLSETAGLGGAQASLLYSVLFAVSLVQLVTGELSDRTGRLPVIVATLGTGVGSLGVLLVAGSGAGTLLVAGLAVAGFGVGAHGFRPVRGAYLTELIPDSVAGGGLGAVRTLLMGAGAVAPTVTGVVADAFGFRVAFVVLTGTLAVGTVLAASLWVVSRSGKRGRLRLRGQGR